MTRNDSVRTLLGAPVVIAVLANDSSAGLTITGYTQPIAGTLALNADQSFTYTPNAAFEGVDEFSYTVRDTIGGTASAAVTIMVRRANSPPSLKGDTAQVLAGTSVTLPVLANDNDLDGDAFGIVGIDAPGHGTIQVLDGQTIRYTPQPGFSGIDSFTYTASDGRGGASTATVAVQVIAPNLPPVAARDSASTTSGTAVAIDALANDNDPEGGALTLAAVTMPVHGNLSLGADQQFVYTPAQGFVGNDSFEYTIRDSAGATADGLVTVEVTRPNAPPMAVADAAATAGQPVNIDPLANDNDPDGDPLHLTALTLPVAGQIALNPQGGVTYTPAVGFTGTDSFTYEVSDGMAVAEGSVTVTVTEPVIPSYANGFRYRRRLAVPAQPVASETAQDFVLLVRESGDWLRSAGNGGWLESTQGFDLRFELADGTKLDHEIERYDATAGTLVAWVRLPSWQLTTRLDLLLYYGKPALAAAEANPAGVWRGLLAVWDARTGADRTGNGRALAPSGIATGSLIGDCGSFNGAAVASQASPSWLNNNAAITVQALIRPDAAMVGSSHGVLAQGAMNGADASAGLILQYLASNAGATNVVHFKVRCSDGATHVISAAGAHSDRRQLLHGVWKQGAAPSIYLDGALSPPSAADVARSGTTTIATGGLYLGAGGRDAATGGWVGLIDEVRIAASARSAAWIATEHANLREEQLFYGLGGEDRPTDANTAPLALPSTVTTPAGSNLDIDLLASSDDPDSGAVLTVVELGAPDHGVVTVVGGKVRYTPSAGYVGHDSFSYTVSDGAKRSTALVAVDVTVPVLRAVNDTLSAVSGQAQTLQVLANDQGTNPTVTAVSDPPHGTAVLNPDGSITYRSDSGYTGSDSFTYTISDGISQATAQVSVTVSAAPSTVRTMDLAYNGLMLGAACHDGEPGNRTIRNYSTGVRQNALVMYLEHLDPIVAFSTENRIDHFPLGATAGGYSDKTVVKVKATGVVRAAAKGDTLSTVDIVQEAQGGDIRWRLAKVTSAETSTGTLAIGPIVGTTDRIIRTGLNASWATEWARCGGTGSVPDSFVQYPTIWFQKPIDPVAQGWQIGDRIAFLIDNSAADSSSSDMAPPYGSSRWCSLNLAFRRDRPDVNRSPYRYQRNIGLWWNSYAYDTEYYPIFLIGHQQPGGQMTVKGNAYGGYAGDGEVTFSTGTRLRQVVKIPEHPGWAGRTIKAVDASLWRWNSDATGSVDLVLRRVCPTLAANQDGTLLAQMSIAARSLVNADGDIKFNISRAADPRQLLALPTHIAVRPGETYHIELAPGPGSAVYAVGRVLNYLRASRGLLQPDYQDSTCVHQRKVGDGDWTTITDHVSARNYLHLGVGLHFNG